MYKYNKWHEPLPAFWKLNSEYLFFGFPHGVLLVRHFLVKHVLSACDVICWSHDCGLGTGLSALGLPADAPHCSGCVCWRPRQPFISPLRSRLTLLGEARRWCARCCWRWLGPLRLLLLLLSCFRSRCPVCPPECFSTRSSRAMSAHRGETASDWSEFNWFVYFAVAKMNKQTFKQTKST